MAMDPEGGIGKDNRLPWHFSEDLQFFKQTTLTHTVIMGRRTYDSLPVKPLPLRVNIVISRKPIQGVLTVDSILKALVVAQQRHPNKKKFIIGGASVLHACFNMAHLWSRCEQLYITKMTKPYHCDATIQLPDLSEFQVKQLCSTPNYSRQCYHSRHSKQTSTMSTKVMAEPRGKGLCRSSPNHGAAGSTSPSNV